MDMFIANSAYFDSIMEYDVNWVHVGFENGDSLFAPDKELLQAYTDKLMTPKDFGYHYILQLRHSWATNQSQWLELVNRHDKPLVVFCAEKGEFAPRRVFAKCIERLSKQADIDVQFLGDYALM